MRTARLILWSCPVRTAFRLLLAGATWRDRLAACFGSALGLGLIVAALTLAPVPGAGLHLLVAPIGASAVLAFAVPASPLAQPWPILGGNLLSAATGAVIAWLLPTPALAAALAVPLAILAMSLARCLHPPGGAMALLAATAGPVLVPAALGSALLVLAAWLFHRTSGHAYPHHASAAAARAELANEGLQPDDLAAALDEMGEAFDIAAEDLALLLARAEHHAAEHRAGTRRPAAL